MSPARGRITAAAAGRSTAGPMGVLEQSAPVRAMLKRVGWLRLPASAACLCVDECVAALHSAQGRADAGNRRSNQHVHFLRIQVC
jgi:hypothetical protein